MKCSDLFFLQPAPGRCVPPALVATWAGLVLFEELLGKVWEVVAIVKEELFSCFDMR